MLNLRSRERYFRNYRGRSNCTPCDHAEAEYQLARITPDIRALENRLEILTNVR